MALRIDCDGCYIRLDPTDESTHKTFAFTPYEEFRKASGKTSLVHFCTACIKKNKYLHLSVNNPFYVEPET